MTPSLTPDQIEQMRNILAQHDAATGGDTMGTIRQFELNNPPKLPYKHQDFPRVVYHHEERRAVKVHTAQQLDEHLENGFRIDPYPAEAEEVELSAAEQAEVAALDRRARQPRKPKAE